MLCANPRETPPMSVKSASSFHRGPAYPRCRRTAAGPHEFAAADELGPTWRAARARGARTVNDQHIDLEAQQLGHQVGMCSYCACAQRYSRRIFWVSLLRRDRLQRIDE